MELYFEIPRLLHLLHILFLQSVLQKYTNRYPIHIFVDWFIDWAQKLLRNYLSLLPLSIHSSEQCDFQLMDEIASIKLSGTKEYNANSPVDGKGYFCSAQSRSFDRVSSINNYQHSQGKSVLRTSLDSLDQKISRTFLESDFTDPKLSYKKSRIGSSQMRSNQSEDQYDHFSIHSPSDDLPESTSYITLRHKHAIVTAQKHLAISINRCIEPRSLQKSLGINCMNKSDEKKSAYLGPDAEDENKKNRQFSYKIEKAHLRSSPHQSLPLISQASSISCGSRCSTAGNQLSKSISSLSHCSGTCSGDMGLLERRELAMACSSANITSTMGDDSLEYYVSASDSDEVSRGEGFFMCFLNALFEVFSPAS